MANYCHNDLYIDGPKREVNKLLRLVGAVGRKPYFDFEKVVMPPEESLWMAYDVKRRDYELPCITFQTAWTPPILVIVALHKMFSKCILHLEWFESGTCKCGGITCGDERYPGRIENEWKGDYTGCRGG